MQDRYTGDIGDFGKLGLLRKLRSTGLSIGVNWYRTPNESHNGDGRHMGYLENEAYRACDEQLWTKLRDIVHSERREVEALQSDQILKASFFSEPLLLTGKSKGERSAVREGWHRRALAALAGLDIIFADPDNGLLVPSASGTARENKYVLPNEILDYYTRGSSVVYYQHKARKRDEFYVGQQKQLLKSAACAGCAGIGLKFRTTSQRYCFFVIQPRHKETIERAVQELLASVWRNHFCALDAE